VDIILIPFMHVLLIALDALFYCIVANVIISWLFAFGILNTHNSFTNTITDLLHRITEPMLRIVRERLPSIAGIDISPFIVILGIVFLQYMLKMIIFKISGL
jgi:YggT family protein